MKAIGITGVVTLHAIFINLGENNELSTVLRLISIKTLLILSGFVIFGKVQNNKWITEKIIRRIPILVIFTAIYWAFNSFVTGVDGGVKLDIPLGNFYIYNFAIGFGGLILWYVWQLVVCYGIIWAFEKYQARLKISYLLKLAILMIVMAVIPLDAFGLKFVKWYGLFIIIGYGLHYLINRYGVELAHRLSYVALALFPLSIVLLFNQINYQGKWVGGGYTDIVKAIQIGEGKYVLVYLVIALLGSVFTYCTADLLSKVKYLSNALVYIGGSTIGILLIHKMFLELKLIDNIWLSVILAESLAIGCYIILKRVKVLNSLLFGGEPINIKTLGGWYGKKV